MDGRNNCAFIYISVRLNVKTKIWYVYFQGKLNKTAWKIDPTKSSFAEFIFIFAKCQVNLCLVYISNIIIHQSCNLKWVGVVETPQMTLRQSFTIYLGHELYSAIRWKLACPFWEYHLPASSFVGLFFLSAQCLWKMGFIKLDDLVAYPYPFIFFLHNVKQAAISSKGCSYSFSYLICHVFSVWDVLDLRVASYF